MNAVQKQQLQLLAGLLVVTAVATNWWLGSIPRRASVFTRLTTDAPATNPGNAAQIQFVPVHYQHGSSVGSLSESGEQCEYSRFTATVNAVTVFNLEPGEIIRIGPVQFIAYDLYVNGSFAHHYTKDDDPTSMRYEHPENVSQVGIRISLGQMIDTADFVFYRESSREPPIDWYNIAMKSFAPKEGAALRHIKQDPVSPIPYTITVTPGGKQ